MLGCRATEKKKSMAWIHLALVRPQQRAHVGTVVSFEVPEQTKDFRTSLRDC